MCPYMMMVVFRELDYGINGAFFRYRWCVGAFFHGPVLLVMMVMMMMSAFSGQEGGKMRVRAHGTVEFHDGSFHGNGARLLALGKASNLCSL